MKGRNLKEIKKLNDDDNPNKSSRKRKLRNTENDAQQSKIYESFNFSSKASTNIDENIQNPSNESPPEPEHKRDKCCLTNLPSLIRLLHNEVMDTRPISKNDDANQPMIVEDYFKVWLQQFNIAQRKVKTLANWNDFTELVMNPTRTGNFSLRPTNNVGECNDLKTKEVSRLHTQNKFFMENKRSDSDDSDDFVTGRLKTSKRLKRKLNSTNSTDSNDSSRKSELTSDNKRQLRFYRDNCASTNVLNINANNVLEPNDGSILNVLPTIQEDDLLTSKTKTEVCPMCLTTINSSDYNTHVFNCVNENESKM